MVNLQEVAERGVPLLQRLAKDLSQERRGQAVVESPGVREAIYIMAEQQGLKPTDEDIQWWLSLVCLGAVAERSIMEAEQLLDRPAVEVPDGDGD